MQLAVLLDCEHIQSVTSPAYKIILFVLRNRKQFRNHIL